MRLVSNSKIVKLPKSSRSVKGVLRQACLRAERDVWTKIIIIGEGDNCISSMYSPMDCTTAIGMLEIEKAINIRDIENS